MALPEIHHPEYTCHGQNLTPAEYDSCLLWNCLDLSEALNVHGLYSAPAFNVQFLSNAYDASAFNVPSQAYPRRFTETEKPPDLAAWHDTRSIIAAAIYLNLHIIRLNIC